MVLGEKWIVKRHFEGLPKPEDFELVKEDLGPLKVPYIVKLIYRDLFKYKLCGLTMLYNLH